MRIPPRIENRHGVPGSLDAKTNTKEHCWPVNDPTTRVAWQKDGVSIASTF